MEDNKPEIPQKRQRSSSDQSPVMFTGSENDKFRTTLNEYRKRQYLCDFAIEVPPNYEFRVHRCILAARSKYFEDLFRNNPTKVRWELTKEGVETCLHFIYTSKYEFHPKYAEASLFAADKFRLLELKGKILEHISLSLNPENCLGIEKIAARINDQNLQKKAIEMLVANFGEVVEKDQFFYTISKTQLGKYISALRNPKVIRKGILKWFSHPKHISRKDELTSFLENVNFDSFLAEDLLYFHNEVSKMNIPKAAEYIEKVTLSCLGGERLVITLENWKGLRDLFKYFNWSNQERAVNMYIINHLATIYQYEPFYEIGKIDLIYFLKSQRLPWSREWETIIWSALVKWIKFSKSRKAMLPELLQAINLSNFSVKFLQEVVKNHELVINDTICLNMLVEALCQRLK